MILVCVWGIVYISFMNVRRIFKTATMIAVISGFQSPPWRLLYPKSVALML
jgi:hypothetical protein